MPDHTPTDRIAQALAAVDVTATPFDLHSAQHGWAELKAQRGQDVHFERLAPAHLIRAPAPAVVIPIDTLGSIAARAHARAVAYIRANPHLGGAA